MCDFKEEIMNSSILVFLILLLLLPEFQSAVVAQPAAPPGSTSQFRYSNLSPPMAIIIVVLIAALFFMAFFSIYIRHCSQSGAGGSVRQALSLRRRNAAARGLDAEVIETFPTFSYAEVKDHHMGKGALECAVCLSEFEDYETLRLIPKCDHVFHPECIDAWLEAHVTCPVCRAELTPQTDEPPAQPLELSREPEAENQQQQQNGDVSIHIASEEEQQPEAQQVGEEDASVRSREDGSVKPEVNRNLGPNVTNRSPRAFSIRRSRLFRKSHSTGHSLVEPGENLSRFTLLLTEEKRKELMNRASLNRTAQGENSSARGQTTGEGSSRGARSLYRRIERPEPEAKSDRWVFTMTPPFFSRGTSVISPKVGAENVEGSTSRVLKTAVRKASFKCLEPKGDDEDGLVSAVSARPPV